MVVSRQEVFDAVKRGVEACRRGEWQQGLANLAEVSRNDTFRDELPGVFYSYFGYGMARFEGRKREGLELCRHAVKLEFYRGENYYNLARTYLLFDNRGAAVRALREGLAVDPKDPRLRKLYKELGVRRRQIVGFLPRSHPVNRFLGRVRHWLGG